MPPPRVLAFDTSAGHCAAALLIGRTIAATRQEAMARGQAERLFPMLEDILREGGLGWRDLDAIGVGIGPGNFTGIRIAVSAARGLALSLGVPAVGVSGFEALRGPAGLSDPAPEIVSLPSPRGWFLQRFEGGEASGPPAERLQDEDGAGPGGDAGAFGSGAAGDGDRGAPGEIPFADADGRRIAERIALVAAARLAAGGTVPRPSPLYIRPADAAPSADAPPVMLT